MCSTKEKGLEIKSLYPVRIVADSARFNFEIMVNVIGIPGFNREASWTMAHLAPCIFQLRSLGF